MCMWGNVECLIEAGTINGFFASSVPAVCAGDRGFKWCSAQLSSFYIYTPMLPYMYTPVLPYMYTPMLPLLCTSSLCVLHPSSDHSLEEVPVR